MRKGGRVGDQDLAKGRPSPAASDASPVAEMSKTALNPHAGKDLLFETPSGLQIMLPCPTAETVAAALALEPAAGETETPKELLYRIAKQLDVFLATALWTSQPGQSVNPANGARITAGDLPIQGARQILVAVGAT